MSYADDILVNCMSYADEKLVNSMSYADDIFVVPHSDRFTGRQALSRTNIFSNFSSRNYLGATETLSIYNVYVNTQ